MRNSVRLRLTAAAMMAALLGGCVEGGDQGRDGEGSGEPGTVPLQVMDQGGQTLAFIPVSISGEGPFQFALDTGASISAVDVDVADDLGLPTTGESREMTGISGSGRVEIAEVDEWHMGDVALDTTEIALIDLPEREHGEDLEGLLGSDVLSGFGEIVIDFDEQVLRLPEYDGGS
ncbi:aspartyl protease family protein [Glycomyces tarimensis]